MRSFLTIIYLYKWKGFKEYAKLKLGVVKYLRFKDELKEIIYMPNYRYPILLRSHTTDYSTFKQIFIKEDYNINFSFDPEIIIDAGANIGLASIYFSNRFPSALVYAIEPEKSNYSTLLKTVNAYSNVTPINAALHHTNNLRLELFDRGIGHWGFTTQAVKNNNRVTKLDKIETVSIYSIISLYSLKIIDILKIDIEGAEVEVFQKNSELWLPRVRCIIIEFHERFRPNSQLPITQLLRANGFEAYNKGENCIFINNDLRG